MKVSLQLGRALSALNGLVGDRLSEARSPLALRMAFIDEEVALPPGPVTLPSRRVALFVHGLMDRENTWFFDDGGYGVWLQRDLQMAPLYLRYNSGRAIADNGLELANLLERALGPRASTTELTLIGHSMGGLVLRSACHHASLLDHAWLRTVRRSIYLGTPHHGAPLERAGRTLTALLDLAHEVVGDPVTRLIADLGNLRSAGIQDLGDADLRHEDRQRRQRTYALRDRDHPVPLLPEFDHYLIAATLTDEPWLRDLFGDAIVPLHSATAKQLEAPSLPASHITILRGMTHTALSHDRRVYAQLHAICSPER